MYQNYVHIFIRILVWANETDQLEPSVWKYWVRRQRSNEKQAVCSVRLQKAVFTLSSTWLLFPQTASYSSLMEDPCLSGPVVSMLSETGVYNFFRRGIWTFQRSFLLLCEESEYIKLALTSFHRPLKSLADTVQVRKRSHTGNSGSCYFNHGPNLVKNFQANCSEARLQSQALRRAHGAVKGQSDLNSDSHLNLQEHRKAARKLIQDKKGCSAWTRMTWPMPWLWG